MSAISHLRNLAAGVVGSIGTIHLNEADFRALLKVAKGAAKLALSEIDVVGRAVEVPCALLCDAVALPGSDEPEKSSRARSQTSEGDESAPTEPAPKKTSRKSAAKK